MFGNSFILFSLLLCASCHASSSIWNWQCVNEENGGKCIRQMGDDGSSLISLSTCRLTCDSRGTLFPLPQKMNLGKKLVYYIPSQITLSPPACEGNVCALLNEAFSLMIQTLNKYHPNFGASTEDIWKKSHRHLPLENHKVEVNFTVSANEEFLSIDTDESYRLEIKTINTSTSISILAPTFFGARHALETLTQLMDYERERNSLQMVDSAFIEDFPAFKYRGIVIDTSRNFLPVSALKRILDGMSYNKLNTFHWHFSDTQSFPLLLNSLPQMAKYGSYSPEEVYTPEDVKDLVKYARLRGIKVIPELDAPAHVGYGWQWGEKEGLGNLVVCLNKQPWPTYCAGPPCGQMNLANENLYLVLEKIYTELAELFHPIEMFHYGGDEVNFNCWNTSTEMTEWMMAKEFGLDEVSYLVQWNMFQEKARQLFTSANKGKEVTAVLWMSTLTEAGNIDFFLDKSKYVIQTWTKGNDPVIEELLKRGFRVIFSNYDALYLDCGVGSWVSNGGNWCSPYKGWQDLYDNDIKFLAYNLTGTNIYDEQILGAEVSAWSEQIDGNTIDAKLWPRCAAHAERLWTNPTWNFSVAESRMVHHRQRLVSRGLKADRLQPKWCHLYEGECRMPWKHGSIGEQRIEGGVEEDAAGALDEFFVEWETSKSETVLRNDIIKLISVTILTLFYIMF